MTVFALGRSTAPLLLYQNLGGKKRTHIVGALAGDANFDGLRALESGRRIKAQAVATRMQVGSTVLAFVRNLNLFHHLNFRSAVVAARDQVKFRFDSGSGAPGTRRRLGPLFAIALLAHVAALTILSGHFPP